MEHKLSNIVYDSQSHICDLLTARELYPHRSQYTKAIHSDPYTVKRLKSFDSLKGHEAPLIHSIPSGHNANIFSARFMSHTDDRHIVSCSADGIVLFTDLSDYLAKSPSHSRRGTRQSTDTDDPRSHSEPESEQFSERRRRTFAIRSAKDMSVTAISIRPDNPIYFAAACGDDTVRIYDQRFVRTPSGSDTPYHREGQVYQFIPTEMRQKQQEDQYHRHRMTSMKFDPNGGGDLCISYSGEKVYVIRPGSSFNDKKGKSRNGGFRISRKQKRNKVDFDLVDDKPKDVVNDNNGIELKNVEMDVDNSIPESSDNDRNDSIRSSSIPEVDSYHEDHSSTSRHVHLQDDIVRVYSGHLNSRTMIWFPECDENDISDAADVIQRNELEASSESGSLGSWGGRVLVIPASQVMVMQLLGKIFSLCIIIYIDSVNLYSVLINLKAMLNDSEGMFDLE
ncbi:17333_t:CDS:2 [Racocetra fulgida]|uniref:17333_t:CDS:1 n=1 Tax=Racocetra fulgida TaxID=60492 RepID=A0A9N9BIY6_9GLOM|nr:17333_t:CDS:2 [Racocetra fulgida]